MLLRLRMLARRLASVGTGLVDAFLRDNKVLPPVLAVLALLVFAWVVAGTYLGDPSGSPVSNQANVARSQNAPGRDPAAPEIENRDVDSYAAYRNKDPFRQLLAPAEDTSGDAAGETTTQPSEDTSGGSSSTTGTGGSRDTDNDGLSDPREAELAQDPQNPDTDGDGILDGEDDADGDGLPDGEAPDGGTSDASSSPSSSSSGDAGSSPSPGGGSSASPSASGGNGGGTDTEDDGGANGGGGRGERGGRDGGARRDDGRPGGGGLLDSGGSLRAP